MRVKAGCYYIYNGGTGWELCDGTPGVKALEEGNLLLVKNLHGCPPANTMKHCYVFHPVTEKFIGMVHTNSFDELVPKKKAMQIIEQHNKEVN